ncbi:MAG: glycosyltransferase family 4 protein [Acidobacteria bacterium]|nr:glycosyltransferase family 4 protein [Acidobacteriota bacterium]
MRIVIEATAALSGGKVYLVNLLPQLVAVAPHHKFIVFHTADLDASSLKIASPNFTFRAVNLPASNERNWLLISLFKLCWRLLIFPIHLKKLRPDVVFSNTGFGPLWRPRGVKFALAIHNSVPFQAELQKEERSFIRQLRLLGLHWLIGLTLRQSDKAIVFSEDLRKLVFARSQKLANATVIHHGIDWGEKERNVPFDDELLTNYGIQRPYLLYVSQLHRYKNVPRLLEAFGKLKSHRGLVASDISLILVGKPTDKIYEKEIAQCIDRLELQNSVCIIPGLKREQLIPLYRSAKSFIYPSLIENCPFAVLEAMAIGLPMAIARLNALKEMAGDAAIYFDPENVSEMADAMERLVWDEDLRGELSRKAIAQAAKFTWEKTARQTLAVLEEVASKR